MYWLFGILVCLDAHLPRPGGRGEELELPTGQETLLLVLEREKERELGEWEGIGRRGGSGNFYKLIKKRKETVVEKGMLRMPVRFLFKEDSFLTFYFHALHAIFPFQFFLRIRLQWL